MNIYLDEMEHDQKVIDAQQKVDKAIDNIVNRALKEMAHWLQVIKDINCQDNHFHELEFKMNIRAAAKELSIDIEALVEASEENARWSEEINTIIWTSLDSREVCIMYDLKPSELLQHEKNGLESFQEDGEKKFQLQDCIEYFDE